MYSAQTDCCCCCCCCSCYQPKIVFGLHQKSWTGVTTNKVLGSFVFSSKCIQQPPDDDSVLFALEFPVRQFMWPPQFSPPWKPPYNGRGCVATPAIVSCGFKTGSPCLTPFNGCRGTQACWSPRDGAVGWARGRRFRTSAGSSVSRWCAVRPLPPPFHYVHPTPPTRPPRTLVSMLHSLRLLYPIVVQGHT